MRKAFRSLEASLLARGPAHDTRVEDAMLSRGGGAAEALGVSSEVDVHVGTLSKALGCHGGFVACSTRMKSLLRSKGRAYMFSTSPAAPMVAAAIAALRVNEEVRLLACHIDRRLSSG